MAAFSFREDNHSACAGRQGFGGGAYQQAFAEVINAALLATTVFSAGQRYIFNGLQICDPCLRGVISLFMIRLNQGQFFPFATFSPVPASRIHRKCKASRFSTRSILPLKWFLPSAPVDDKAIPGRIRSSDYC